MLAEMAKGLLRNKIPELKLALEGRVNVFNSCGSALRANMAAKRGGQPYCRAVAAHAKDFELAFQESVDEDMFNLVCTKEDVANANELGAFTRDCCQI